MIQVYYNELDPYPAQWLENLIAAGHLPAGYVDRRSIVDVQAWELPDTCHFFAGIGGWPLALQMAGYDGPVWTGSCPCQPFSSAGQGKGFDDERHLWPAWLRLIRERLPPIIFGEQVASKAGRAWLDVVSADLEALGYAVGAADLCAAGVGAPHIRQRLYFVAVRLADDHEDGRDELSASGVHGLGESGADAARRGEAVRVDDRNGARPQGRSGHPQGEGSAVALPSPSRGMEHSDDHRAGRDGGAVSRTQTTSGCERIDVGGLFDRAQLASATRGFWSGADWLACRDERVRPVEPGSFPLVARLPGDVGRLRAYGNAIVPQLAAAFIEAALEVEW